VRIAASILAALLAAAAAGCVPSRKLADDELDRYWYLQSDVWEDAEPLDLTIAKRKLPSRWTFRREDSLVWSTVSIVRAMERLKQDPEAIEIGVHKAHADMLAQVLAEGRRAVERLREVADPDHPPTPERWSGAVAHALTLAEHITRVASPQGDRPAEAGGDEPLGWSAGPMLEMAIAYLNERSAGSLLAGTDGTEAGRLRAVLAQMVLRLGFSVIGKQDSPRLVGEVRELMSETGDLGALEKALREKLLAAQEQAAPAGAGGELRSVLAAVFAYAPPMFEVLESFARQWDRMDSVAVEFRRWRDEPLVSVIVSARQEVRMAELFFMQPMLVFRGASRITVLGKVPGTGETAVLFEPVEGGATEVRFEGSGYGLVRALAMPLASGTLREVRVAVARPYRGTKMVNVALLMEAHGGGKDPRRVIAFQDVRQVRVVRDAFDVRTEVVRKDQTFNYITPDRRYTYVRSKRLDER